VLKLAEVGPNLLSYAFGPLQPAVVGGLSPTLQQCVVVTGKGEESCKEEESASFVFTIGYPFML
jgi:hypothetical protein